MEAWIRFDHLIDCVRDILANLKVTPAEVHPLDMDDVDDPDEDRNLFIFDKFLQEDENSAFLISCSEEGRRTNLQLQNFYCFMLTKLDDKGSNGEIHALRVENMVRTSQKDDY